MCKWRIASFIGYCEDANKCESKFVPQNRNASKNGGACAERKMSQSLITFLSPQRLGILCPPEPGRLLDYLSTSKTLKILFIFYVNLLYEDPKYKCKLKAPYTCQNFWLQISVRPNCLHVSTTRPIKCWKSFDSRNNYILRLCSHSTGQRFQQWRIQERRPGARPFLIFRPNWGPKGRKTFFWRPSPPFSKGLDDRYPPPPLPLSHGLDLAVSCIVWTLIRYMTLHFRVRRGAVSLRYRNRAEIHRSYVCERKPYPLWLSCRRHSYLV